MRLLVFILFNFLVHHSLVAAQKPQFTQCSKQINEILKKWKGLNDWRLNKPVYYLTPTENLGEWVVVHMDNEKYYLSKVSEKQELRLTMVKKSCAKKLELVEKKVVSRGFTDSDLKKKIGKDKQGIIYLWSPHMPLSVQGLPVIKKLSKKKNWDLIVLLDPKAKADKELEGHFSKTDLVRPQSFELKMRNAYLHYPMLLGYKNGKILNKVKYGFEEYELYEKYFDHLFN